jgi:hypothetical protein
MADDMTPAEIEYVRAKAAGITDVARLQTLCANDTTLDRTVFDAADPSAWTIAAGDTIGGFIIQKKGSASDATAIPLWFQDVTDTPTNGAALTLTFDAAGLGYTQQ